MKSHEYWMQQALQCALQGQQSNEVPVGSVLVINDKIVSKSFNQPISTHDPTAHAEICVLRDAARKLHNYRLNNSILYVTLEPCCMCMAAAIHARVAHLVFGAYDTKNTNVTGPACLKDLPFNHKIIITGNIMAEQCSKLLRDFFIAKRSS